MQIDPASGLDGFGRVLEVKTLDPNSNSLKVSKRYSYNFVDSSSKSGLSITALYREYWDQDNSDYWLWQTQYIDSLGRHYRTDTKGYDTSDVNSPIITKVEFDSQGRVHKEYVPHYRNETDPKYYQHDYYDGTGSDGQQGSIGRLKQLTGPDGFVKSLSYDLGQRQVTLTYNDPSAPAAGDGSDRSISSTKIFNSRGRLTQTQAEDNSTKHYDYDRLGRRIKTTDALGQDTVTVYNSLGYVTSVTNNERGLTTFDYYDNGQLFTRTDAKNQKVTFDYDRFGRVIQKAAYAHKDDSQPTQSTCYTYDDTTYSNALGRLTQELLRKNSLCDSSQDAEETYRYNYAYHADGKVKSKKITLQEVLDGEQSDERSYVFGVSYDALGRSKEYTYPDGSIVRSSYYVDGHLNQVSLKEPGDTNYQNYATYSNYTALGEYQDVAYGNNVQSEYTHDSMGRILTSKTLKQEGTATTTFLDYGYSWNLANRLRTLTDNQASTRTQQFDYYNTGRLKQAQSDAYGTYTYNYDFSGNLTQNKNLTYTYDGNKKHQLASVTLDGQNNPLFHMGYDDNGNMVSRGYDEAEELESAINVTGEHTGQVTHQSTGTISVNQANVLESANMQLFAHQGIHIAGDLTVASGASLSLHAGAGSFSTDSHTWFYDYDEESRLTQVSKGVDKNSATVTNRFTYDSSGKRLSKQDEDGTVTWYVAPGYEVAKYTDGTRIHTKYISGASGVIAAVSRSEAALNQTDWVTAMAALDNGMYSADSLASGHTALMASIVGGQSAKSSGSVILWLLFSVLILVLAYNAFRAAREASMAGRWRAHLAQWLQNRGYLTPEQAQAFQMARRTEAIGKHPVFSALVPVVCLCLLWVSTSQMAYADMIDGNQGAGRPTEGAVRYFHKDHVYSTALVTDNNGQEVARVAYKPFGLQDTKNSTGTDDFRAKFGGNEWDNNSSLYHFNARYYDPVVGRFLTPDPAWQYDSPYIFGADDPLGHIDPDGRFSWSVAAAAHTAAAFIPGGSVIETAYGLWWAYHHPKEAFKWLEKAAVVAVGVAIVAAITVLTDGTGTFAAQILVGGLENTAFGAIDGDRGAALAEDFGVGVMFAAVVEVVGVPILKAVSSGVGRFLRGIAEDGAEAAGRTGAETAMGAEGESSEFGCSVPASFVAGTEVLISQEKGQVAIEDVAFGTDLATFNEQQEIIEGNKVSALFNRVAYEQVWLTVGDTVIKTTPEHPFYVVRSSESDHEQGSSQEPQGEWIEAKDLTAGDLLLTAEGETRPVAKLESLEGPVHVFNFEVANNHNYYVSDEQVLVHNPSGCGKVGVGGNHGYTRQFSEANLVESDHVPAMSSYEGTIFEGRSRDQYPALTIPHEVHRALMTTGSRLESQAFRYLQQHSILETGSTYTATLENILLYEEMGILEHSGLRTGLRNMLDYAWRAGFMREIEAKSIISRFGLPSID